MIKCFLLPCFKVYYCMLRSNLAISKVNFGGEKLGTSNIPRVA